jgi:hypothetical protein
MNPFAKILAAAIASLAVCTAHAEGWICIADKITGFSYENGSWTQMKFNVEPAKYIIKKPTALDQKLSEKVGSTASPSWVVYKFGAEAAEKYCAEKPVYGMLSCVGLIGYFAFSPQTLTFADSELLGYIWGRSQTDTPTQRS